MAAIWSFPTRIVFGAGEGRRTGDEAKALGIRRALVVTDRGVVDAGLCQGILSSLGQAGIEAQIFSGVDSNPSEANIEAGAAALAAHKADGVVCIGGGSPMDAG